TVTPVAVETNETVTISVRVSNSGDVSGTYEVELKIDNVVVTSKSVTVAGKSSQTVTFTTSKDKAGTYTVNIDGMSSSFVVAEAVTPPPPPAKTNWALIVGIIGGVIIVAAGVVVAIMMRRKKY
ncbi:MAG: CARDB domain-containing protein, partial [Dehalococcoidales bacterium]|nr:CARDB domain-containing protein [Dehalococcoidales bacterium]